MNEEYFEFADRLGDSAKAQEISDLLSVDIRRFDRKFTEEEAAQ